MHGRGGGLAEATKVSSRGEYNREGWVLVGGVEQLSWWFSGGSVLASASSVILSSSVWKKITIGRAIA